MKMLALLGLVLVGVLAAPVTAAPEGFRDSARLAPIASALVGKPVYVRCSQTDAAWSTLLAPWPQLATADAVTFPENEGIYLHSSVCRPLEGWLRGKNTPRLSELSRTVLILAHEVQHVRGVDGESEADCGALQQMPAVLRSRFGVTRQTVMQTLMAFAREWHRRKPPEYRTLC